jgi:hypothetical protein
MKIIFYLLIVAIIVFCLTVSLYRTKKENFLIVNSVPEKPDTVSVNYDNNKNSLLLSWKRPISLEPITSYLLMIKKLINDNNNIFMNFVSDSDCETCSYTFQNLKLEPSTIYTTAVIAINKYGASDPSTFYQFTTPPSPTSAPTSAPTPTSTSSSSTSSSSTSSSSTSSSSTSSSSSTPTPTSTINQVMGEDLIQSSLRDRQIYLDNELKNMTVRANGVYELNASTLEYPNTYLDDVKQSIKTINDSVKRDLQEYRLNVHVSAVDK